MLKSVNGPSTFAKLLKDTKIAQLQASIGDRVLNSNNGFPTHQIIESPSSSFSRRDFGLKMRIPKKIKTRRIIVNDLDNKYGLPNFETLNGDYFKRQRFQELGIPVNASYSQSNNTINNNTSNTLKSESNASQNPLFPSSKEFSAPQTVSGLLHIKNQPLNSDDFIKNIKPELKTLRRPFLKWLAKNNPESFTKKSLYDDFKKFIQSENPQLFNNNKNFIPSTYADKLSGTAGLSYNLKGRLFQTPNGPQTSKIVPGRIVSKSANYAKCAVGGFIANVPNVHANNTYVEKLVVQNRSIDDKDFARQFKIPTTVTNASLILDNKRLDLFVNPIKPTVKSNSKFTFSTKEKTKEAPIFDALLSMLDKKH